MNEDMKWALLMTGIFGGFLIFLLIILAMANDQRETCVKTLKDRPAAEIIAVCKG
jgi:hypothetical protein